MLNFGDIRLNEMQPLPAGDRQSHGPDGNVRDYRQPSVSEEDGFQDPAQTPKSMDVQVPSSRVSLSSGSASEI